MKYFTVATFNLEFGENSFYTKMCVKIYFSEWRHRIYTYQASEISLRMISPNTLRAPNMRDYQGMVFGVLMVMIL